VQDIPPQPINEHYKLAHAADPGRKPSCERFKCIVLASEIVLGSVYREHNSLLFYIHTAETAARLQPLAAHPHESLLKIAHWCYLPVRSKHGCVLTRGFYRRSFPELMFWLGGPTVRKLVQKATGTVHVSYGKHSSILYHFPVNWLWMIMTLKSGLYVTEGHSNWYHSKA